MKKFFLTSVAVLALAASASVASAADIDINLGAANTVQTSVGAVNQLAGSGDISIGTVSASNFSSTAANLNNDLTQEVDVSNLQSTNFGGEAGLSMVNQASNAVSQVALSVNGQGAVSGSTITSIAANINNDAQVHVTVH